MRAQRAAPPERPIATATFSSTSTNLKKGSFVAGVSASVRIYKSQVHVRIYIHKYICKYMYVYKYTNLHKFFLYMYAYIYI